MSAPQASRAAHRPSARRARQPRRPLQAPAVRRRSVFAAAAVAVVAVVCAGCSNQQPDPPPAASGSQQPSPPAAPVGSPAAEAKASPKVSDLGPGWAEVFSGYYSQAHGGVWGVWVEPWPLRPDGAVEHGSGDHALEFVDGGGRVLEAVSFDAEEVERSTGEVWTRWFVRLAHAPNYASYRVVRVDSGGERSVVFEFARSESAPVVSLDAPGPGEVVSGPSVRLKWTMSDADGDELTAALYYSLDAGATYQQSCCLTPEPVGADDYGTYSWDLERDLLEGSRRARVMVVVSDGSRWGAAESPTFNSSLVEGRLSDLAKRPSAAATATQPLQQVPVRFVVSADAGSDSSDGAGGALAGVTVAIVKWHDRQRWWSALGAVDPQDGYSIRDSIPPGAQVASTPEQISAAPAQLVTTQADGSAQAELDRSEHYLFCATVPDDAGLIAGCTSHFDPLRHSFGRPVTLHIHFRHGRAYLTAQEPAAEAASLAPGTDATVTVIATRPASPSYANDLGQAVWTYLHPGQDIAVVAGADIGRWWDTISKGSPAALSYSPNYPILATAELIDASPAQVITTGQSGIATAQLTAGHYLLCSTHGIGQDQLACIYHHITTAQHNYFHTWCCTDDSREGIEALTETQGRALLDETQHLKTWPS